MKHFSHLVILVFFISASLYSFGQNAIKFQSDTITKKLTSDFFEKERTVKIVLPDNYDAKKTYPVIYTLDGYGLFHITSSYAYYLMKYDVIPQSIVVSLYHNDRNYETSPNYGLNVNIPVTDFLEGSDNLKNHLIHEIVPLIDQGFSTSGFSVLIGHSNTATFVNEIITEAESPFQAYIAITPDLLQEQIDFLEEYITPNSPQLSYFVSSGTKDDPYRLETGRQLDTVFNNAPSNFKGQFKSYEAGHMDLVPKSLNDALMFVFSEYRNFSEVKEAMKEDQFSLQAYIDDILATQSAFYGIKSELKEEDFFYLSEVVASRKNKALVKELLDISEENSFYSKDHLYSDKAQTYESAGFYEEALINWKLQLDNGYYKNAFYFLRPFALLTEKLNRPEEAVEFLEFAIQKFPEEELRFRYLIAKTSVEHDLDQAKGLTSITYCLDNFRPNKAFSLEEAKKIKATLIGQ